MSKSSQRPIRVADYSSCPIPAGPTHKEDRAQLRHRMKIVDGERRSPGVIANQRCQERLKRFMPVCAVHRFVFGGEGISAGKPFGSCQAL
jgi:hypothetical protein